MIFSGNKLNNLMCQVTPRHSPPHGRQTVQKDVQKQLIWFLRPVDFFFHFEIWKNCFRNALVWLILQKYALVCTRYSANQNLVAALCSWLCSAASAGQLTVSLPNVRNEVGLGLSNFQCHKVAGLALLLLESCIEQTDGLHQHQELYENQLEDQTRLVFMRQRLNLWRPHLLGAVGSAAQV